MRDELGELLRAERAGDDAVDRAYLLNLLSRLNQPAPYDLLGRWLEAALARHPEHLERLRAAEPITQAEVFLGEMAPLLGLLAEARRDRAPREGRLPGELWFQTQPLGGARAGLIVIKLGWREERGGQVVVDFDALTRDLPERAPAGHLVGRLADQLYPFVLGVVGRSREALLTALRRARVGPPESPGWEAAEVPMVTSATEPGRLMRRLAAEWELPLSWRRLGPRPAACELWLDLLAGRPHSPLLKASS